MRRRSSNTVALCWGLFHDQACKCVVLPPCPHACITNGWNSPAALHPAAIPQNTAQLSLGWTHALLLAQDGTVFVADASDVYNSQLKHEHAPQSMCVQQQQQVEGSHNCSIWQAVKLQRSCSSLNQSMSGAITVTQVAAGDLHCLMLDSAGCVWAMGSNKNSQLGRPVQLSQDPPAAPQQPLAGTAAAAAIQAGSAERWEGSTKQQQQQQKQQEGEVDSSRQAALLNKPVCVLGPGSPSSCQEPVRQIAAGACHSCAVTAGLGRLYCWGWNAHGQCGTGSTVDIPQPTLCTALDGVPLSCGAAGMAHTVVASRDGAVYAMGWNSNGQLGLAHSSTGQLQSSSLVPLLVEDALLDQEHVIQVACGSRHTVALTAAGKVFTWGLNTYAQCCTSHALSTPVTPRLTGQKATSATAADNRAEAARVFTAAVVAGAAAASSSSAAAAAAGDVVQPQLVVLPATVAIPAQGLLGSTVACTGLLKDAQPIAAAADDNLQQQQQQQQQECGASILVQICKAVAVSAGGWHTIIEVDIDEVDIDINYQATER